VTPPALSPSAPTSSTWPVNPSLPWRVLTPAFRLGLYPNPGAGTSKI
jgi:hypothetical protein